MAVTINGDGVVDVGGNASSAAYVRLYEDSDNGTNYVDLIAPASVASNRTLTMPDASGTIDRLNRAGNVLQVVNATFTTQVNSSSSTFADIGLEASITPSSASSKVLVFCNINGCRKGTNNTQLGLRLLRDSTAISTIDEIVAYTDSGDSVAVGSSSITYLDSPSTTSSITYKTQLKSGQNNATVSVNSALAPGGTTSTITLMEIAG